MRLLPKLKSCWTRLLLRLKLLLLLLPLLPKQRLIALLLPLKAQWK